MPALQQLQTEYRNQLKPILKKEFEEWASMGIVEYLKSELLRKERARFIIGKKYGITTIDEMDAALSQARLKEEAITDDDYMELAELEKEITAMRHLIERPAMA